MQFDDVCTLNCTACKTSQNLWKIMEKFFSSQDVPIKKTSLHTAHKNPINSLVAIRVLGLYLGFIVVASIQLHQVILDSNSYSFSKHMINFSP